MTETNMPQNIIKEPTRSVMTDYVYMLSVPLAVAIFTNGFSAVVTAAISVITCALLTFIGRELLKIEFTPKSAHSFVIGVSVAMLLPAASPWWMTVLTAAFAMGVCVLPFGIPENSPFSPPVAAICFATLCWPEYIYNYSETGSSLGEMLLYGNSIDRNIVAILEALVGNVPSAMGTGCILALVGTLIFLVIRRPKDSIPVFSFLLTVVLIAIIFPRVSTGRLISVIMELCSGMIFFGAIFVMSVPEFSPKRIPSKLVWGIAGGIICMLIRYVSPLQESACFGFLIICAISDSFDKLPLTHKEKRAIQEREPFTEIATDNVTVVPDEILSEIPDMTVEEIAMQEEKFEVTITDIPIMELDNLDTVISTENTVSEQISPFISGGDGNE